MVSGKGRGLPALARMSLLSLLVLQATACNVFGTEDEVADEARVVIAGTGTDSTKVITSTRFERWLDDQGETHTTLLVSDTVYTDLAATFDEVYPVKPDIGFLVRVVNRDTVPAVISIQVYFDGKLNYDVKNASLVDSSIEFSHIFANFNTIY